MNDNSVSLVVRPIGYIRNRFKAKFAVPHQPTADDGGGSIVELLPRHDYDKALTDLEGFDYIWLIWWFHRNNSWRPKVCPPRGPEKKRGVFATRSPHRPNPLGISAVRLLRVSRLTLEIGECDLLDGTPILDIKPYLPSADSFPSAQIGWLAEVEALHCGPPPFTVSFQPRALEQIEWLAVRGINFIDRAITLLERDPTEHPTRRIKRHDARLYRMGCAEWRIFFTVGGNNVEVNYIRPGFPRERLLIDDSPEIANREIQLDYYATWPEDTNVS